MNILCSFAQSQIKRKKSRTVITAAAISLSVALLTAVVNFVASGNIMLTGFLGTDYGYAIMADYTAKFKNTITPKPGADSRNAHTLSTQRRRKMLRISSGNTIKQMFTGAGRIIPPMWLSLPRRT